MRASRIIKGSDGDVIDRAKRDTLGLPDRSVITFCIPRNTTGRNAGGSAAENKRNVGKCKKREEGRKNGAERAKWSGRGPNRAPMVFLICARSDEDGFRADEKT